MALRDTLHWLSLHFFTSKTQQLKVYKKQLIHFFTLYISEFVFTVEFLKIFSSFLKIFARYICSVYQNSNTLATWCEELTNWNRCWCWERLKAGGEGDDSGWDGWMASLTQWTWVWANPGRWWKTGKHGILQSMGFQRVGHDLVAEQQQQSMLYMVTVQLTVNMF